MGCSLFRADGLDGFNGLFQMVHGDIQRRKEPHLVLGGETQNAPFHALGHHLFGRLHSLDANHQAKTGNGRTGKLYAYQHFGIMPDIVSTAKGLGGGLPIGATLMGEKVQNVLKPGDHGSTYGGNPVCCAGALSVIERLDENFLNAVRRKSGYVFATLYNAPGIESVTGLGLMIGIKTVKPAKEVVAECMNRGVLCLTAKDKVRLLPALNIPMDDLCKAIDILKEVCAK